MLLQASGGNLSRLGFSSCIWEDFDFYTFLKGKKVIFSRLYGYCLRYLNDKSNVVANGEDGSFTLKCVGKEFRLSCPNRNILYPRVPEPWWIDIQIEWTPQLHWVLSRDQQARIETWLLVAQRFQLPLEFKVTVAQLVFKHETRFLV